MRAALGSRAAVAVGNAKANIALDRYAALWRPGDSARQLRRQARTGSRRWRSARAKKKQEKGGAKSHVQLITRTRLKRERPCLFRGALRMFMRA
jgi:hypothetical protein